MFDWDLNTLLYTVTPKLQNLKYSILTGVSIIAQSK